RSPASDRARGEAQLILVWDGSETFRRPEYSRKASAVIWLLFLKAISGAPGAPNGPDSHPACTGTGGSRPGHSTFDEASRPTPSGGAAVTSVADRAITFKDDPKGHPAAQPKHFAGPSTVRIKSSGRSIYPGSPASQARPCRSSRSPASRTTGRPRRRG